mmetsp:Transcript_3546/g.10692  ORF Transcript_3546/g.10692 Transcript_3546/m.10692 type:complete len:122 (-) Transcript_3546:288-653(-)
MRPRKTAESTMSESNRRTRFAVPNVLTVRLQGVYSPADQTASESDRRLMSKAIPSSLTSFQVNWGHRGRQKQRASCRYRKMKIGKTKWNSVIADRGGSYLSKTCARAEVVRWGRVSETDQE